MLQLRWHSQTNILGSRISRSAMSLRKDSFKRHPKASCRRCCGLFLKRWPSSRSTSALAEEAISEAMLNVQRSATVLYKPFFGDSSSSNCSSSSSSRCRSSRIVVVVGRSMSQS